MMTITFNLEAYQGPLDLLLQLVEKNEIDIYDIPIARLADQYLEALESFPSGMESMSEFLLMASTLLEIKSKMLLPKPIVDGIEEEDPREMLALRLAEYKRFKAVTETLRQMSGEAGVRMFKEPDKCLRDLFHVKNDPDKILNGLSLENLFELFEDVLGRREMKTDRIRAGFGEIQKDLFTIESKSEYIMNLLFLKGNVNFTGIFMKCYTRSEKVVTFLALLELIKNKKIVALQDTNFQDILITRECADNCHE